MAKYYKLQYLNDEIERKRPFTGKGPILEILFHIQRKRMC